MAQCEVTVTDADGKRWTLTLQAASRNAAVFAYNAEQVSGSHRNYPKMLPETEVEVRVEDGRVFRTTFGKVLDWSNRHRAGVGTR